MMLLFVLILTITFITLIHSFNIHSTSSKNKITIVPIPTTTNTINNNSNRMINNNNDENNKNKFNSIIVSMIMIISVVMNPLNVIAMTESSPVSILKIFQQPITDKPSTPQPVIDILRDRAALIRSFVTNEKVGELRVGESLVDRLRSLERELDGLQKDIYQDNIDWDVVNTYPKILRVYTPLFTSYTDKAFPSGSDIDVALRYALRYEVGGFYTGVKELEDAITKQKPRQAQRAFARISLSYDHYLKAGDLYVTYDEGFNNLRSSDSYFDEFNKLSYIAPSIEAPGLQDDIILLKGPDKGREGQVLWISKGNSLPSTSVIIKLKEADSGHREVKYYPYSFIAKPLTPPSVLLADDFRAAYIASAISSGIMYPIDSYKTRLQSGRKGIPSDEEGGIFSLWKGVKYFILDANDAVYLAFYGLLKPILLGLIDPDNTFVAFAILTLAGSFGDAIGSMFRVPCEIVYKQIQTGTNSDGLKVLRSLLSASSTRFVVFSWVSILCRDMPFAGLQIAFFELFKSLLSGLDDMGISVFVQRAIWGACAGSTASLLTTPFDAITTYVLVETDISSKSSVTPIQALQEIGPIFIKVTKTVIEKKGIAGLFTGALARVAFFAPAAAIFFFAYESIFEFLDKLK